MSKNIEIHTQTDPEDTFVDIPGTSGAFSGKPKQARIFGQADAIQPGSITDREAPVYDEDMTPEKAVEHVRSNPSRAFTLFNTSGDVA
ncbi:hypothetical protein [Rhodococcus qingshengii]|uniref:hypothetical protein n=1 Tax=Rhodococcus qingshengii TaxID=334542 RepID=UPI00071D8470|nr:hypothetical protein [Rhodococcus qingshengii]KSU76414.1 hypothetical protein AS032_16720 [Rhodococcus qingshengii]SCC43489.1 hypothetical protein GA0061093_108250 [Rhodococcus qingshengii]